ncbi:autophagy- protein 2 [Malassezia sp. CBS 17886]|nr:autophagy- protein 2 [Malassezia sp. CBS 17886]
MWWDAADAASPWRLPSITEWSIQLQQRMVRFLLRATLGRVLRSPRFDAADATLSLQGGRVEIADVLLDADAVNGMIPDALPQLAEATAALVAISLPWPNLFRGAVRVEVKHARVCASVPEDDMDPIDMIDSMLRASQARAEVQTELASLRGAASDRADAGDVPSAGAAGDADQPMAGAWVDAQDARGAEASERAHMPSVALALGAALLRRLQLTLSDVVVTARLGGSSVTAHVPALSLGGDDTGDGAHLDLMRSCALHIPGLTLSLHACRAGGPASDAAPCSADARPTQFFSCGPLTVRCETTRGAVHEGAHDDGEAAAARISVHVVVPTATLVATPQTLRALCHVHARAMAMCRIALLLAPRRTSGAETVAVSARASALHAFLVPHDDAHCDDARLSSFWHAGGTGGDAAHAPSFPHPHVCLSLETLDVECASVAGAVRLHAASLGRMEVTHRMHTPGDKAYPVLVLGDRCAMRVRSKGGALRLGTLQSDAAHWSARDADARAAAPVARLAAQGAARVDVSVAPVFVCADAALLLRLRPLWDALARETSAAPDFSDTESDEGTSAPAALPPRVWHMRCRAMHIAVRVATRGAAAPLGDACRSGVWHILADTLHVTADEARVAVAVREAHIGHTRRGDVCSDGRTVAPRVAHVRGARNEEDGVVATWLPASGVDVRADTVDVALDEATVHAVFFACEDVLATAALVSGSGGMDPSAGSARGSPPGARGRLCVRSTAAVRLAHLRAEGDEGDVWLDAAEPPSRGRPMLAVDLVSSRASNELPLCVAISGCTVMVPQDPERWLDVLSLLQTPPGVFEDVPPRDLVGVSVVAQHTTLVMRQLAAYDARVYVDVVSTQLRAAPLDAASVSVQLGDATLYLRQQHAEREVLFLRDVHALATLGDPLVVVDVSHGRALLLLAPDTCAAMLACMDAASTHLAARERPASGTSAAPAAAPSAALAGVEEDAFCEPLATTLDELPDPDSSPRAPRSHRTRAPPAPLAYQLADAVLEHPHVSARLLRGATLAPQPAYFASESPQQHPFTYGSVRVSAHCDVSVHLYGGDDFAPRASASARPRADSRADSRADADPPSGRRATRTRKPMVVVHATGVRACVDVYDARSETRTRTELVVRDVEVLDQVPTSTWNKFLTRAVCVTDPRQWGAPMARLVVHTMRPGDGGASELRIRARVVPLRMHVDQDVVDFFEWFAARAAPAGDDRGAATFIQYADVDAVQLTLDYKPKRVNVDRLYKGRTLELMNLFNFDASAMSLRHITLHGVHGLGELFSALDTLWSPDVKANQMADIVAGIAPMRTAMNLGAGLADLVLLPLEQYQSDRNIARGVRRGTTSFARAAALETARLGARLSAGTHVLLERAEHVLGGEIPRPLHGETVVSGAPHDGRGAASRYRDGSDADVSPGLQGATRGALQAPSASIHTASSTIFAVPAEVTENTADGTPRTMVRAIPIAVVQSAAGASDVSRRLFVGLQTMLDPQTSASIQDKYKGGRGERGEGDGREGG